jgi:hypothetical protein
MENENTASVKREAYLEIRQYHPDQEAEWDAFIDNQSINGTFLQSRRFLNYHKNRFADVSLMFYRNSKLVCVCPGCEITDGGEKIFYSHKGSTFGGLIFDKKEYAASQVLEIIEKTKSYLCENGYVKAILKITPDIFSLRPADLLEYCLWSQDFENYCELSTYVDYSIYGIDIAANFNSNHRRKKNRYEKLGATFRALENEIEIREFHKILEENLAKHGAIPVHTFAELLELQVHLPDETEFYGVFQNDIMLAGTMMFYFHKVGVAHTQYLCSRQSLDEVSPMSFLYFNILQTMRDKGFKKMSWGISTEEQGRLLNTGLIWFKESVGSSHAVNRIYLLEDIRKEREEKRREEKRREEKRRAPKRKAIFIVSHMMPTGRLAS